MTDSLRSTLQDLPPSAKLVYKTLEYEGPLTQGQLAEQSLLPARTVRYALSTLEDEGVVTEELYIQDARKRLYSLAAAQSDDAEESGEFEPSISAVN
ncbi:MAG: helix-turn-helix domain-containing protein [Euryarchaeota archaeon]|nr:helix-turn-helix domain-containing protein [Euryarchaeota archaeon]